MKVDYIFQDVWARESQILATLYFERSFLHFSIPMFSSQTKPNFWSHLSDFHCPVKSTVKHLLSSGVELGSGTAKFLYIGSSHPTHCVFDPSSGSISCKPIHTSPLLKKKNQNKLEREKIGSLALKWFYWIVYKTLIWFIHKNQICFSFKILDINFANEFIFQSEGID